MKVSVSMITYNHEKFIAKALDSILMQKTDFDFEIVIGEDCSQDNTRAILIEYQKRHPDKFRLLLNERNLGGHLNAKQTYESCTGEYVALLNGDDYWTSPDKLQKQVDFLDGHPDFSACFHDSLIVYADGSQESTHYRPSQKSISTVEDLLLDNYIPTSAVMYRRRLLEKIPDWIGQLKLGDWPMHLLYANQGNIGYLDETLSVYLVHPGGVWSLKDWQFREFALIEFFEAMLVHLDPRYAKVTNRLLRWKYLWVSETFESEGKLAQAKTNALRSVRKHLSLIANPFRSRISTELERSMPDYIKAVNSKKLFSSYLRLFVVPFLKARGIVIPGIP